MGTRVVTYGWAHGEPVQLGAAELGRVAMEIHQVAAVGGELVVVSSSRRAEVACNSLHCDEPAGFAVSRVRGAAVIETRAEPTLEREPLLISPGDLDGDHIDDLVEIIGDHAVLTASTGPPRRLASPLATSPRLVTIDLSGARFER